MPMLGTISSNGASFKAVGGVLKVPVKNILTNAHYFTLSVDGKRITGSFPISTVGNNKQITTEVLDGEDRLEIEFWEYHEEEYDMDFFLPLPCGTYNNLTFSLYEWEPADNYLLFSKTPQISGGLVVHRNEIIVTPPLPVVVVKNTPNRLEFDGVPYGYSLDANQVLNLDQFDDDFIELSATIYGKNENKLVEEVKEELISCNLVNVETDTETALDFTYDGYANVSVVLPTDTPGEFKVVFSYDDLDPVESFKIKVHEAALLPDALSSANWSHYSYSPWFNSYRVTVDGTTYLKTYAASLRTSLPDNAFRGSFGSGAQGEPFDAFSHFSQITSIPSNAFYGCVDMTGITLPSSVTSIGTNAFRACKGMTEIDLPSGITSIGEYAFYECFELSSLQLPAGVTSIGSNTFNACYNLKSINLENVVSIGQNAFIGCDALEEIVVGNATIGQNAFNDCDALQSITIGDASASGSAIIGLSAFVSCPNLSQVNLVSVSSIGQYAFWDCPLLTSITLPDGLNTIAYGAFSVTGLTSITIPASVTILGDAAFRYCGSLQYIVFEGTTPPSTADVDTCFEGTPSTFTIKVPASAVQTYKDEWPSLQDKIVANQ